MFVTELKEIGGMIDRISIENRQTKSSTNIQKEENEVGVC